MKTKERVKASAEQMAAIALWVKSRTDNKEEDIERIFKNMPYWSELKEMGTTIWFDEDDRLCFRNPRWLWKDGTEAFILPNAKKEGRNYLIDLQIAEGFRTISLDNEDFIDKYKRIFKEICTEDNINKLNEEFAKVKDEEGANIFLNDEYFKRGHAE